MTKKKTASPPSTQPKDKVSQADAESKADLKEKADLKSQDVLLLAKPQTNEAVKLEGEEQAAKTAETQQSEQKEVEFSSQVQSRTRKTEPAQPQPAEVEEKTFLAEAPAVEETQPVAAVSVQAEHAPVCTIPSLFVVHITPELTWVAKVGGLGDVVFGLSNELELRGHHVEIILPKYDCLRYDHIFNLTEVYKDLWVPWYGGAIHCSVYFGFVHGRKCFFIDPHSQDNFFNRGCIYGFNDDVMRFAFFSRAAMEFLWKSGKHPDIIHIHDWQTALVPVFLYEIYKYLGMTHPRVCYTIHNFKHQGVTGAEVLYATGLNRPEYYFHYDRLRDNWNPHALNLMKGGIVYSNFVTTVSRHYAMEAKDKGQGFGLEPTLHIHHMKYGGVINGVDYSVWNPEVDHYIPFRYGLDNLDDKYKNKKALRERLLLADNEKPIVAFIGRLDPQKGLELIRHAIFYTLHRRGQFVLLGSSPDHQINGYFWGLKHQLNDNPDCHLEIGFNEELSHLIYAGADMIVVPSRFEPCGLTQLIAMRYGTIPIVREIGGLADTVHDKDFSSKPLHERNGYVFRDYDYPGLESALGRAISCYYDYPEHFRELIKNAMRCDYSWKNPGQDYLNIYDYIRDK
ncbi:MAG: glycogen synthase GlgA [Methylohalobius sp.]|nr:glycogen synthase GlgA [Methylohalobius sp.]